MENFEDLSEKAISPGKEALEPHEDLGPGKMSEILLNVREQEQMMEQLIRNQIEVKDDMISRLHRELEYYRQESADRFADQLMKAVIKVRKQMMRIMDSGEWSEMSGEDLRREYTYVLEDLTDLLEQQNIDPYRTEPGEMFDAAIHQPKLKVTDVPELDKTVKESLGEGYKKGAKVLLPERVVVYQYKNREKTEEIGQ